MENYERLYSVFYETISRGGSDERAVSKFWKDTGECLKMANSHYPDAEIRVKVGCEIARDKIREDYGLGELLVEFNNGNKPTASQFKEIGEKLDKIKEKIIYMLETRDPGRYHKIIYKKDYFLQMPENI